jgi:hypothetical protein
VALFLPILSACATNPPAHANSSGVAPFFLEWRQGPWVYSRLVTIDDHQAVCTLPNTDENGITRTYRRLTFAVTDAQLSDLQQMLIRGKFSDLPTHYGAAIMDGTFVRVTLAQGEYRKDVTCNNEFPPLLNELQAYLFTKLIPQDQPTAKVEQMNEKQALEFWNSNR